MRYYLNIKALDIAIEQQFRQGEWFLLIGTIINLLIYLGTYDLDYTFHFFIPLSACVILVSAYLLLLIFRLKTPFAKYLIMGVAFMVFTTVFRLIYTYLEQIGVITQALEIDAFGGVLGGVLDAICLNLGLNYKHRLENLEKQRALETIRNSIASDLHDDLGSGLSTIRVMSEMAQTGIKEPEKQRQIQRIAQQANDLIERMATIIWAMNTRNDTVESLINYVHDFALDFFDNIGINSHFSIEEMDPSVTQQIIIGETRRQIFLTFVVRRRFADVACNSAARDAVFLRKKK